MTTADVDGERMAVDACDGGDREADALLEHVERLIARAFGSSSDEDDEQEEDGDEQQEQETVPSSSSSSSTATASADGPDKRLLMGVNPEEEVEPPTSSSSSSSSTLRAPRVPTDGIPTATTSDAGTAREKVLQRKLARTLLELADARDNAQLAARAGTVLLEKLARAEGDADALRDELEASARENARLQRVVGAMDDQLRRFELVETPARWRSEQPASSSWRSPSSYSPARTDDACRECEERRQDARTARQERDQLRRQCLELELQVQSAHQIESDLRRELERAKDWARRLQSELATASSDRDALAERHQALQEENVRLVGVRETLRATVRALRADRRALGDRLGECEQQVEALERDKREFATRAQIADNRRARAERDGERLLQTLAELSRVRRSEEQQAEDQSETIDDGDAGRGRGRRRKKREDTSAATTAAELLRLDSSGSDGSETPATALSIDTSDTLASPPSLLPAPVVRVRPQRAQWALSLPHDASHSLVDTPTTTSTSSPVTPSAVAARRAALVKRLSGVDHYCIAGSSAGVNGPDIRLLEAQTQQQTQQQRGDASTASENSDTISEAAAEKLAPPASPMYIGLSLLVACATAAGIAARR